MNCTNKAAYRFTWPGRDESFICEEHSKKLQAISNAMGMCVQLIPIFGETPELCRQK